MTLTLSPRRVLRLLLAVVLLLTLLGVAVQILRYVYGLDYQMGLYALFNLGADGNLPTWYASVSLLFCSGLLGGDRRGETATKGSLHSALVDTIRDFSTPVHR